MGEVQAFASEGNKWQAAIATQISSAAIRRRFAVYVQVRKCQKRGSVQDT